MEALNDPEKPCYGQFGGQYSFMVNFVLLEAVATYLGIKNVETESQRAFLGRCLILTPKRDDLKCVLPYRLMHQYQIPTIPAS